MSLKSLGAGAVLAAAALVIVPLAAADQVHHTSHAAVHAVAGAPLQSGFVNDIHSNGAVNSAREEYQLNGAEPNTTYQVELLLYADQSCSGTPFAVVPTAQITTNGAGNGTAGSFFPAGAPNNPPLQIGITWEFVSSTGDPVYATDCVPISVD